MRIALTVRFVPYRPLLLIIRKYSGPVEAIKHKAAHQGSRVVFGFVQVYLMSYSIG